MSYVFAVLIGEEREDPERLLEVYASSRAAHKGAVDSYNEYLEDHAENVGFMIYDARHRNGVRPVNEKDLDNCDNSWKVDTGWMCAVHIDGTHFEHFRIVKKEVKTA